jgi:hypothetical protein
MSKNKNTFYTEDIKLKAIEMKVEFLYKGKVYSSVVSGLTFTDSFDLC